MENVIIAVIWVVCGVLSFGLSFGYYQNAYPNIAEKGYLGDFMFSLLVSLLGPITLISWGIFSVTLQTRDSQPMKFY